MREPNRPSVHAIAEAISELDHEQIARITLLAVWVATELGRDSAWNAWQLLESGRLSAEEKSAIWLYFDSSQRATIRELSHATRQSDTRRES